MLVLLLAFVFWLALQGRLGLYGTFATTAGQTSGNGTATPSMFDAPFPNIPGGGTILGPYLHPQGGATSSTFGYTLPSLGQSFSGADIPDYGLDTPGGLAVGGGSQSVAP